MALPSAVRDYRQQQEKPLVDQFLEWVNDHAFLLDFETVANNRFAAINQLTLTGIKQPSRPDIDCLINPIPFSVRELKSPSDEHVDIRDAFNQLEPSYFLLGISTINTSDSF